MKRKMPLSSRRQAIQLSAGFICVVFLICAGLIQSPAAEDAQPLPPPLDMEFTSESASGASEGTFLIRLKVIPREDMHADIRCFLPDGVEPQDAQGVAPAAPDERYFLNNASDVLYRQVIGLYVGPLAAGVAKEFSFHIKAVDKAPQELVAIVEALAEWGMKEQRLTVGT